MANFATRVGYPALVPLRRQDSTIPFSTLIKIEGGNSQENNTGIVGDAGQIYLSGLPEKGPLAAKWGQKVDKQCRATFDLKNAPHLTNNPVRLLTLRVVMNTSGAKKGNMKMKKLFSMGRFISSPYTSVCLLMSILAAWQPVSAETITIGKGTGIIWEGMPFDIRLNGAFRNPDSFPRYGLMSISDSSGRCASATSFKSVAGYKVLPIAPGVGFIPRATGTVTYYNLKRNQLQ